MNTMRTPAFLLAALGSLCVHSAAYGVIFVIWLYHVPPSTPPIPLMAYGASSLPGLAVDTISLDPPGTYRHGNENTPGGDDAPKPTEPAPELELSDEVELAKSAEETPEPTEANPLPASPKPADKNDTVAKLPGAPGGS